MSIELVIDAAAEDNKVERFLKNVDTRFYHRIIENRQKNVGCYFPHRGETGTLFIDTFQYVKLGGKKKD